MLIGLDLGWAKPRMGHRRRHPEVLHLRIGKHLVDAEDRPAGDAGLVQLRHPPGHGMLAGLFGDGRV
jgi:hypothetical protein